MPLCFWLKYKSPVWFLLLRSYSLSQVVLPEKPFLLCCVNNTARAHVCACLSDVHTCMQKSEDSKDMSDGKL